MSPGIGFWMFLGSEKVGSTWTYPGQSSWSLGSFHLGTNLKVCQVYLMKKFPNLPTNTTHTYQLSLKFHLINEGRKKLKCYPGKMAESSAQQLSAPKSGKINMPSIQKQVERTRVRERERARTNEDLVMLYLDCLMDSH